MNENKYNILKFMRHSDGNAERESLAVNAYIKKEGSSWYESMPLIPEAWDLFEFEDIWIYTENSRLARDSQ